MTDAVIYDRGYKAYDGERLGRRATRRAIVKDGIRRILGIRRKARRKVLPWSLLAIGLLMAAVLVGQLFLFGSLAGAAAEGLPSYPELFDLYSRIALLFLAITIPELLGPDRAQGVISVYFSRPMSVTDYLTGKAAAYVVMAASIYLVPQMLFHLGAAALAEGGFLAYLGDNLDVLWKVGAAALGFILIHGGVLAVVGAYVDRTSFAAATFLGILLAGGNLAGVVSEAAFPGARYASLLALDDHARYVRDWIFDTDLGSYWPERAGFDPWVSLVVIAVVAVAGSAWVYRRYRRLA
jgi:ABC-2 type transport system permease protein